MIEGLVLLGAGYLLGNTKARNYVSNMLTKSVQTGIDSLNNKGVDNNATETIIETDKKE